MSSFFMLKFYNLNNSYVILFKLYLSPIKYILFQTIKNYK